MFSSVYTNLSLEQNIFCCMELYMSNHRNFFFVLCEVLLCRLTYLSAGTRSLLETKSDRNTPAGIPGT